MRRRVEDVMTVATAVVSEQAPLTRIVRTLREARSNPVLVVDEQGVLVGVLSDADLLSAVRDPRGLVALEAPPSWSEPGPADEVVAAELMSSPPVTVTVGTTVAEAARLAASASVKRLPVVDDRGRLVGIVTRGALLQVFLRPDEEIRREVVEAVRPGEWSSPMTLDVTVSDGVVTLRGQVQRRGFVVLLVRMAEAVEGVVRVSCKLAWDRDDIAAQPLARADSRGRSP
jgi:CBS domain-containing protein